MCGYKCVYHYSIVAVREGAGDMHLYRCLHIWYSSRERVAVNSMASPTLSVIPVTILSLYLQGQLQDKASILEALEAAAERGEMLETGVKAKSGVDLSQHADPCEWHHEVETLDIAAEDLAEEERQLHYIDDSENVSPCRYFCAPCLMIQRSLYIPFCLNIPHSFQDS